MTEHGCAVCLVSQGGRQCHAQLHRWCSPRASALLRVEESVFLRAARMAMCFCAAGRELERLTARPRSRAWGLRGQTPALLLGAGRGPAKFPTWMLRHAADASFVRQEDAHLECSAACDTACVRMLLPAIAIQAESDLRGLDAGSCTAPAAAQWACEKWCLLHALRATLGHGHDSIWLPIEAGCSSGPCCCLTPV